MQYNINKILKPLYKAGQIALVSVTPMLLGSCSQDIYKYNDYLVLQQSPQDSLYVESKLTQDNKRRILKVENEDYTSTEFTLDARTNRIQKIKSYNENDKKAILKRKDRRTSTQIFVKSQQFTDEVLAEIRKKRLGGLEQQLELIEHK